jgi:hypothetical protein
MPGATFAMDEVLTKYHMITGLLRFWKFLKKMRIFIEK